MIPKKLKKLCDRTLTVPWDPAAALLPVLPQTITVYPPPLFLFSPRTRVYEADKIQRFVGYLSAFDPATDDGDCTATITITPIP